MNDPSGRPDREAAPFRWSRTRAPRARRYDDIYFLDAQRGWAVNSNGHVRRTVDGGNTWPLQFSTAGAYVRCVGFADDQRGWVGTLTANRRLFHTKDGGTTWTPVANLPPESPSAICGLSVVNERVLYASGTNFPDRPTGVIKSVDGGDTWTGIAMGEHATLLVDIYFRDEQHGWVVGGKADRPNPDRDDVIPVVLFTENGGQTWENRLAGMEAEFPRGEWGWKIQFLTERVGFVSLENFTAAAILKTGDGGRTWERLPVRDPQGNANLEGVGFLDERHGWVGGWGDEGGNTGLTSQTNDGGTTWTDANEVGRFLNRFRFIRQPELVAYASGDSVYKFAAGPAPTPLAARAEPPEAPRRSRFPLRIAVDIKPGTPFARVDIWDRFGEHLATPLDEVRPQPGRREVAWSGDPAAVRKARGVLLYRVTTGEEAESHAVLIDG